MKCRENEMKIKWVFSRNQFGNLVCDRETEACEPNFLLSIVGSADDAIRQYVDLLPDLGEPEIL